MNRPSSTLCALCALLLPLAAFAADKGSGSASDKDAKVPAHQKHPVDAHAPKPTGAMVDLKLEKGTSKAYLAKPKGEPKGAVLVIHEWWGLNDHIKHTADLLAAEGYLALAIDLYKGVVAKTAEEAGKAMGALDEANGDSVEEAAVEWLKKESGGKKVATIGWCMGGGQSLNASLHDPKDVAATVIYYGMPVTDVAKLKTLKGPVLGIWANKDGWITPDKVAAFAAALKEAGIAYTGYAYDADHAFANPTGGKHNPEAAKDAWGKTLAFLGENLK
jgi:carboxymethylenebutenolidase